MEDFGSFWTFQENVDELKQKLQSATYELEITRNETNEKIRKNSEYTKKLLQLLQSACKERDDAQAQLKKLQQILAFNTQLNYSDQLIPTSAPFSPDSPLLSNFPAKTNSGLTESNTLSFDINNNNNFSQSQSATSPDSSNIGLRGNNLATTTIIDNKFCSDSTTATTSTAQIIMPSEPATNVVVDQATLIIENLAKGRSRPQQGKLLQAVIEAGPLLQTLMVAGSLPQWRNPPGLLTRQIPPVNLKGCDNKFGSQLQGFVNTSIYGQINGGSMGIFPKSTLDFGGASSNSCFVGGRMMPSLSFDYQLSKRHRIL